MSKGPPAASVPRPAVWERLQSNPIRLRPQPDIFIPINSTAPAAAADRNNQETISNSNNLITSSPFDNSVDHQINNQAAASQPAHHSPHHVSVCVNDLHTTLFIDEDALNTTKTTINSNNNGGKGTCFFFIKKIRRTSSMRVPSFVDAVDRKEQQFFHLSLSLSFF